MYRDNILKLQPRHNNSLPSSNRYSKTDLRYRKRHLNQMRLSRGVGNHVPEEGLRRFFDQVPESFD